MPDLTTGLLTRDNCGTVTIVQSPAAGTVISTLGAQVISFQVTDESGNVNSCSFTVTLVDNAGPVLICNNDTTVNVSCGPATITLPTPVATDACGGPVTVTSDYVGNVFPIGTTSVTWTATDVNGNTSTCVQLVNVTSPEIDLFGLGNAIADNSRKTSTLNGTNYGNVCIGSTLNRTFEIRNNGTADLVLSGNPIVQLTGVNSIYFTVVSQPSPTTIPPGGVATFTIAFSPVSNGAKIARVRIFSDDCDESEYNFTIKGKGRVCQVQSGNLVSNDPNQNDNLREDEESNVEEVGDELDLLQGLDELDVADILYARLYPNPNEGRFTISLNKLPKGDNKLIIVNNLGEQIYQSVITEKKIDIDLPRLVPGLYYIQIVTENDIIIKSMIKTD